MPNFDQDYLDAAAAYIANADYDETEDVAKAKSFRTACRRLKHLRPNVSRHVSEQAEFDAADLQVSIDEVNAWLAAYGNDGCGNVLDADFRNFRD